MKKDEPIKIGLVGELLSGKDTVADYLVEKYGFTHISTGDLIRAHVLEQKLGEPTRPFLVDTANELRARHGPDYLVKIALKNPTERLVISGLRNPAEAESVKKAAGIIVVVTASLDTRYDRSQRRKEVRDQVTFEEFKNQQQRENFSNDPNATSVKLVVSMADHEIENDGTEKDLYTKIDKLFND